MGGESGLDVAVGVRAEAAGGILDSGGEVRFREGGVKEEGSDGGRGHNGAGGRGGVGVG